MLFLEATNPHRGDDKSIKPSFRSFSGDETTQYDKKQPVRGERILKWQNTDAEE